MKFKILIFQLCVIVLLIAILFFSMTWIIIYWQNPQNSFKEAMSLTLSFLGPLSTIFAAIVATFLFNDWKEQHNMTIIAHEAKLAFKLLSIERGALNDLKRLIDNNKNNSSTIFFKVNDVSIENKFEQLLESFKESRQKLFEFILLIEGQSLFDKILEYRNKISDLNRKIIIWQKEKKSYDEIFDQYSTSIDHIDDLNFIILNEIKKLILYEIEN